MLYKISVVGITSMHILQIRNPRARQGSYKATEHILKPFALLCLLCRLSRFITSNKKQDKVMWSELSSLFLPDLQLLSMASIH